MAKNVTMQNGGAAAVFGADLAKKLAAGIAESRASTIIAGGKPLLRLLKDGEWVYGQNNEACGESSRWVVNLMTLAHGWSCWVEGGKGEKNTLAGEVMVSMSQPKPPRPDPIEGTPFAEQRSFELKCLEGEDQGAEVLYKTGSHGGLSAVDGLLAEIQRRLHEDPERAFPVLALDMDHYNHPKWGKTYKPILEIVGWVGMDAQGQSDAVTFEDEEAAMQEPEEEPAPAPKVRRTRAPKPAPETVEPKATAQLHQGQRRRPGPQAVR